MERMEYKMMNPNTQKDGIARSGERGNVLFLILIAVALFAALSYAVTQSTRSGGGDANRETTLVNSSTITQYPASIKTAIVRMLVSNGVTVDQLTFDPPSSFTSELTSSTLQAQNVFHPSGGGASYAEAPASVMANNQPGTWRYNGKNQIHNIGQNDANGNDIIAFLPNVSRTICERIHAQLGISGIPTQAGILIAPADDKIVDDPVIPNTTGPIIGNAGGTSALNGQPQGCFQQGANYYIYYHVLVER